MINCTKKKKKKIEIQSQVETIISLQRENTVYAHEHTLSSPF